MFYPGHALDCQGMNVASTEEIVQSGTLWNVDAVTAFGGFKSRSEVPPLIDDYERGDLKLDHYITHRFEGVEGTIEAVKALHSGECLRAVVTY